MPPSLMAVSLLVLPGHTEQDRGREYVGSQTQHPHAATASMRTLPPHDQEGCFSRHGEGACLETLPLPMDVMLMS